MLIIGCDYHPSVQQIAFVDTDTGECGERRLQHMEEAEQFYRELRTGRLKVRIGLEASGYSRWFERLIEELGFELWIGDAAVISRQRVRKHKIYFNATVEGRDQIFRMNIHDKYRVERQVLEAGAPDSSVTIPRKTVKTIAKWAAKRYVRASFPTSFNDRLTDKAKEIVHSSMASYGLDVSGTFIAFVGTDQELTNDETYSIIVRIVAPVDAVADVQREEALIKLQAALQSAFGMCRGIEVLEVKIDSEAEFSLDDYQNSRLWDYEFVSAVEDDADCSMTGM